MLAKAFRVIFITGRKHKCKTIVVVCSDAIKAAECATAELKLPKEDIQEIVCLSDLGEQVVKS